MDAEETLKTISARLEEYGIVLSSHGDSGGWAVVQDGEIVGICVDRADAYMYALAFRFRDAAFGGKNEQGKV